jgi:hypothetical protein
MRRHSRASTVTNGYGVKPNATLTAKINNPFFNLIPSAAKTSTVGHLLRPYTECLIGEITVVSRLVLGFPANPLP